MRVTYCLQQYGTIDDLNKINFIGVTGTKGWLECNQERMKGDTWRLSYKLHSKICSLNKGIESWLWPEKKWDQGRLCVCVCVFKEEVLKACFYADENFMQRYLTIKERGGVIAKACP